MFQKFDERIKYYYGLCIHATSSDSWLALELTAVIIYPSYSYNYNYESVYKRGTKDTRGTIKLINRK